MTLYVDIVQMRAGATPDTWDGAQSLTLNSKARKIIGLIVSNSLSVHTTDEGEGIGVELKSESNWSHVIRIPAGYFACSGPATNNSAKLAPQDIVPLDLKVDPNTKVTVNITTLAGDTQTGTNDVTIGIVYSDGSTPADILNKFPLIVPLKGGNVSSTAIAVTTETALTTFTIPPHAKEIIGCKIVAVLDGAVTQSEEITGYVRVDLGITEQTPLNIPINGGQPGLGTEVEGSVLTLMPFIPLHTPLPNIEITVKGYINMYSAITGGAELIFSVVWR